MMSAYTLVYTHNIDDLGQSESDLDDESVRVVSNRSNQAVVPALLQQVIVKSLRVGTRIGR